MTVEEAVLRELRLLPPDKKNAVLDYVKSLGGPAPGDLPPRRKLRGLWAGKGIALSAEEIDAARQEAWGTFPRDDIS